MGSLCVAYGAISAVGVRTVQWCGYSVYTIIPVLVCCILVVDQSSGIYPSLDSV